MNIAITIPLYNQVHYTKLCLDSIRANTPQSVQIFIVDNASSDGTADYLAGLKNIHIISNADNRGCSGAWNQGIAATAGFEWLIILNNDTLMSPQWLEGLLLAAEKWELDIVSPAIREGEYNYDMNEYSAEFVSSMRRVIRLDQAHGICFMVRRKVFETIGVFDENFKIGQYEDTDFFLRARNAGFRLGTVGTSFIHHYGSVTQDGLKKARAPRPYALENKAYFIRKWELSWWKRAINRNSTKLLNQVSSMWELMRHGHTLVEKWIGGRLRHF